MTEAEWLVSDDPLAMLQWVASQPADRAGTKTNYVASDRKLRLLYEACAQDECREETPECVVWFLEGMFAASLKDSWATRYAALLRDIVGNPWRPVRGVFGYETADGSWYEPSGDRIVLRMAQNIYVNRAFDDMPILADALEDAGCDNADILDHCRRARCPLDTNRDGDCPRHKNGCPFTAHVRGCWVIDLLLGKE